MKFLSRREIHCGNLQRKTNKVLFCIESWKLSYFRLVQGASNQWHRWPLPSKLRSTYLNAIYLFYVPVLKTAINTDKCSVDIIWADHVELVRYTYASNYWYSYLVMCLLYLLNQYFACVTFEGGLETSWHFCNDLRKLPYRTIIHPSQVLLFRAFVLFCSFSKIVFYTTHVRWQ